MKCFLILLYLTIVLALPLQTSFKAIQTTRSIEEEECYVNTIEHYENIVDVVLSSESEELLINLSHIPRATLDHTLQTQAYAMGIYPLNRLQRVKMPVIIGKHIHEMNLRIYQSIQPTIDHYWSIVYNQETQPLSSLNGIIAQHLMDQIDAYNLLGKIKQDLDQIASASYRDLFFRWFREPEELDFLSQHVSDIKTSLLLELHIQLMDFLTRIQVETMELMDYH
ncbi:hypothetical protein G6F56_009250 [Rhizopus delemar]|uniref:Uncharacterized protein n=1 Tax=Rhizopus stolonifer TaxID=4846 RepID=A0A367JP23_RHIST|nr:hypothetical protein G6F56_009250 [Rhizopus delemar]RCH91683.1 hypothetical protein CU098_003966 [Rhizopus stolonifer]